MAKKNRKEEVGKKMALKEFVYRGKTWDELQRMSIEQFSKLLTSKERRSLNRGFREIQKTFLEHLKKGKKNIKTHCRDLVVIPQMVGQTIRVYTGKDWAMVIVEKDMIGHRLGEFALTRKRLRHSAPGIGATRSSASLSVR